MRLMQEFENFKLPISINNLNYCIFKINICILNILAENKFLNKISFQQS